MSGLSAVTGELLPEGEHLRQSIADILMTPIGTRVMRRDYGSYLPRLIDAPADPARALTRLAAAADAIRRWEPRVILRRITLDPVPTPPAIVRPGIDTWTKPTAAQLAAAKSGHFTLTIEAFLRDTSRPQGEPLRFAVDLFPRNP